MLPSHVAPHKARLLQLLPPAAAVGVLVGLALPGLAKESRRKYPAPTGRIHFKTTNAPNINMTEKTLSVTTSVVCWSDYGRKWRQDVHERWLAKKSQTRFWTVCDGTYVYQSDPKRRKHAVRMSLVQAAKSGAKPFIEVDDITRTESGKHAGKSVAGKPCDDYHWGPSHYSEWQGTNIVLRYGFAWPDRGGGLLITEARKVELNVKIAAAQFRVPPGFKVENKGTGAPTYRFSPAAR